MGTDLLETYLRANITELRNETADHVVLLVKRSVTNHIAILVHTKLQGSFRDDRTSANSLFLDFWKLGEEEHNAHSGSCTCDCKVDVLHIDEAVSA
jgi:hypothetical protein